MEKKRKRRKRNLRLEKMSPRSREAAVLKLRNRFLCRVKCKTLNLLTPLQRKNLCPKMEVTNFKRGEFIVREGDEGNTFFVVEEGTADVFRSRKRIATFAPYDFFGEVALQKVWSIKQTVRVTSFTMKCVTVTREVWSSLFHHLENDMQITAKREEQKEVGLQEAIAEARRKQRMFGISSPTVSNSEQPKSEPGKTEQTSSVTEAKTGPLFDPGAIITRGKSNIERIPHIHSRTGIGEHPMTMRLPTNCIVDRVTSRPKYFAGQRIVYRTQLFDLDEPKGCEVQANVHGLLSRSDTTGVFVYRVQFVRDNLIYRETRDESQIETVFECELRKIGTFVLRMKSAKLFAAYMGWREFIADQKFEEEQNRAAKMLQSVFRMAKGQKLALFRRKFQQQGRRIKRKKLREQQRRLRLKRMQAREDAAAREHGYTLDGEKYFLSKHKMQVWVATTSDKLGQVEEILRMNQDDAMLRALRRWRGAAIKLRLQAQMAIVPKKPSYELALRDIEKSPYDKNKAWHPATGQKLLQLPLLTGSKKCLDGTVQITNLRRFKQFTANMRGPMDVSNWVVMNKLLVGGYPCGQARKNARFIRARGDCLSVMLLHDITAYFCLMERGEEEEVMRATNFNWRESLRGKFENIKKELLNGVKAQKNLYKSALIMYEKTAHYPDEFRKQYVQRKEKAGLLYNASLKKWEEFPKEIIIRSAPMPEDPDSRTIPDQELVALLVEIEALMREGRRVYVFSRHGHGRVGVVGALLLGRLYGLTADEALARSQRYHDARQFLKEQTVNASVNWKDTAAMHLTNFTNGVPEPKLLEKMNLPPSCPFNQEQTRQVRRILERSNAPYASISRTTTLGEGGKHLGEVGDADNSLSLGVTRKQRGVGLPNSFNDPNLPSEIVRTPRTKELP